MDNAEQFDWSDKRSIVIPRVDAIAVYTNSEGDIIIRQQHAHSSVDSVIRVPARSAHSVIEGLQREQKGRFAAPLATAHSSTGKV